MVGSPVDTHAPVLVLGMGALRFWRWVSGSWRPGFGAGVRRRDAGFGTEAR